jgi:cyclophilin family peptidyl-prolyl cis-trans isomerase
MLKRLVAVTSWWTCLVAGGFFAAMSNADAANPVVVIDTNKGKIEVELFEDKTPITVKNFLQYVDGKHYDGLIFHRVINGFMIQGGGMDSAMKEKSTKAPIKNEAATSGVKNERGTIAMARTSVPDSATSQFFINHKDNDFLNASPGNAGYAAFGKVVAGMDVVDEIAKTKTGTRGFHQDVPLDAITIKSVTRK